LIFPVQADVVPPQANVMTIQVTIPYSIGVRLEVKCDWEWQKNAYKFHKFILVPSKQPTTIRIPNYLKSCEAWPKLDW